MYLITTVPDAPPPLLVPPFPEPGGVGVLAPGAAPPPPIEKVVGDPGADVVAPDPPGTAPMFPPLPVAPPPADPYNVESGGLIEPLQDFLVVVILVVRYQLLHHLTLCELLLQIHRGFLD